MGMLRRWRPAPTAATEAEAEDAARLERRRIVAEANGENIEAEEEKTTPRTPRAAKSPRPQNLEEAVALVEKRDRETSYRETWEKALHRFRKRRPPVYCCRNPDCLMGFGTAEDLKEHIISTGASGPALPGGGKANGNGDKARLFLPCLGRVGKPWLELIEEDIQFYQSPTRALKEF